MPIRELPISKGTYKTQNSRSLRNSEFAEVLRNLFIDEAGANFDRPTLDLFETLDSIESIGAYYFGGYVVFVTADRKIYSVDLNGDIDDVTGEPLPGVARPVFADNGTTLFIAGGGAIIKWAGFGNTTALLGGSPPDATHIVFLDGYLLVNRRLEAENNKVVQYSDLDTTETWPADNIFTAMADPDEIQAVAVAQREIYLVGEQSLEVWQNLGTDPVPFGRVYIWQYGTPAPYSVCVEDNSLFFLDQNRRIWRIAGRQIVDLGAAIQAELSSYESVNDCWSASFTWKGAIHVIFVFPTAGAAWSIDLRNSQWTEWSGFDNGTARVRLNCLVYLKNNGSIFAGDYATGKIWQFSDSVKTDAGGVFERGRRFGWVDAGGSIRKRANMIRANLNRNVAAAYTGTSSETNPTLEWRWRDDGREWSDWRQGSIGERGENRNYIEFRRLGVYRSRQHELRVTDPCEFNLQSVEVDEEVQVS